MQPYSKEIPQGWGVRGYLIRSSSNIAKLLETAEQLSTLYNTGDSSLMIATIPPVDLKKSRKIGYEKGYLHQSEYSDADIQTQQWHLEADIKAVNDQIAAINNRVDLPTIRWDRDVMKIVIKRNHDGIEKSRREIFTSAHLKDGVHPDEYLKGKWFSVLCKTIVRRLPHTFQPYSGQ